MIVDFGITNVATAGTAVQVNNVAVPLRAVSFKALSTNGGTILIGRSDVEGVGTLNGWPLLAGEETPPISIGDGSVLFNVFWVDATVNNDKVAWMLIGDFE